MQEHLTEKQIIGSSRHRSASAREQLRLLRGVEHERSLPGGRIDLRLGKPIAISFTHIEPGGCHSERLCDPLLDEAVQIHSGGNFYDTTEHVDGCTVFPDLTRLMSKRNFGELRHHLG